eukprot:5871346-Pyramimonas_sp.AAC.1
MAVLCALMSQTATVQQAPQQGEAAGTKRFLVSIKKSNKVHPEKIAVPVLVPFEVDRTSLTKYIKTALLESDAVDEDAKDAIKLSPVGVTLMLT